MTREEAKEFIQDISNGMGSMAMEYWSEKTGYKLREALDVLWQEPCEDAIDRYDMLDAIGHGTTYTSEELQRIIKNLPPVQPKQRTGKWVLRDDVNGQYQCNECGMFSGLSRFDVEDEGWKLSNFCSNCGAKMEVEE